MDPSAWKDRLDAARDAAGRGDPAGYLQTVDELVQALSREAGWDAPGRAVVAQGGYGRRELAPRSDVDLLFLVASPRDAPGPEEILYPLWDLGFEVGHALRTPRDCRDLARSDLTAATALLDARVLAGQEDLLATTLARCEIRTGGSRRMRRWVEPIVSDVETRRGRFGEVSHLLEPHLKEGRGGLRDFHACRWVVRCVGQDPSEALERLHGGAAGKAGAAFIGRVRAALHGAAGRKTDHLTFEFHGEVAERLSMDVEDLFARLHRAGHAVASLWEAVASELSARPRRIAPWTRKPGPRLSLPEAVTAWAATGGPLPADLRNALAGAGEDQRRAALQEALRRLWSARTPVAPVLRALHGLGFLGDVAPEVEAVAHRVPYDARHAYTVGVHCIETLAAAEDLWRGAGETDEPHLSRIASRVTRPAALRVAALAHDLGKARQGADHAAAGQAIAAALARRLGLDEADTEHAAWLVARHHLLTEVAFGRDLEDPRTTEAVRAETGSTERLDALTVLSYADLVATRPGPGPRSWTDWSRALLLTVHARCFDGDARPAFDRAERWRAVAAVLGEGAPNDLARAVPDPELRQVPPDLLAALIRLAGGMGEAPARWAVLPGPDGPVEILGACHATPRLLSAAAGALASLGFDIRSFQAHTWPDGIVHLWFRAEGPEPRPPRDRIVDALDQAITGRRPPRVPGGLADPRQEAMPVETVLDLRAGSPFHSELEIRCRDRRGLLAQLTRTFDDLGLTVSYALVTTHGPVARDMFHLKDIFGGRVESEGKQKALLGAVRAIIEPPQRPPARPGPGNPRREP